MAVTRTIEITDFTPAEAAQVFCDFDDFQQARFFAAIWEIASAWSGAGWCQQSCSIVQRLDADGRSAVAALAAHLAEQQQAA